MPTLDKYFRLYQIHLHVYMTHSLKGIPGLASQAGAFLPPLQPPCALNTSVWSTRCVCMCVRHYNVLGLFALKCSRPCCVDRCAKMCSSFTVPSMFIALLVRVKKKKNKEKNIRESMTTPSYCSNSWTLNILDINPYRTNVENRVSS